MSNSENKRRRRREPLLPPSVQAARNKEMKQRLSASSLVLGGVGRETRDWSLSSAQPRPTDFGALDPAQREHNLAMKKGVYIGRWVVRRELRAFGVSWGAGHELRRGV